jgi:hypothetical protein
MVLAATALGQVPCGGASHAISANFVGLSVSIAASLSIQCALTFGNAPIGVSYFPSALDAPSNLFTAANNKAALTTAELSTSALALTVNDASTWPASGVITLDHALAAARTPTSSEIIYYEARTGNILTLQARAEDGTTAKLWPVGSSVEMRHVAKHHNLLASTIVAIEAAVFDRAPIDHEHAIDDVTGLQPALDAKGDASDVAAIQSELNFAVGTGVLVRQSAVDPTAGDLYYASQYGIVPDSEDNTDALQALLNTIALLERNAVIVFEDTGPYEFGGLVQDATRSNCIIKFPTVGILGQQYTITLRGGQGRMTFSPSAYSTIPLPAGTRIRCSTNSGGAAGPAFIGGIGPIGDNVNDNTFCCAGFENLIFLMPQNPALTCLNLDYFTNTFFKDCCVIAGNSQAVFETIAPTTATSYGVKQPRFNSGINQRVEGVLNILGFYNGIRVGEGALIQDLGVWSCRNGMVYDDSHGNSRIMRVIIGWCPTSIQINAEHPLIIDEYDCERWTAAAWYTFVRDINDPTNVGRGELRYRTVIAGVGHSPGTFTVNGAANIYIREMGTAPA